MGGGGCSSTSHSQLLKARFHKAFFQLIKAYKRYYLGICPLKIAFYKLFFNQNKIKKWKEKHLERFEFLQSSLQDFKSLKSIYAQAQIWLCSKEFKEKYKEHTYPPYFNPKKELDYESIPANLAWELNLPLPRQNYDLINISNGCSASAATLVFLKECGVNSPLTNFSFKRAYKEIYEYKGVAKNALFFYYTMWIFADKPNAHRFKTSLDKKVPFLYIARDPISRLRCVINHFDSNPPTNPLYKKFNLTCAYADIIPTTTYWYSSKVNEPDFSIFEEFDNEEKRNTLKAVLALNSILENLKDNISFIHCVEFNDLKADCAFDTFCELASIFGFEKPHSKENFTNKIWNEMYSLFPVTLYAHSDDLVREGQDLSSLHQQGGFDLIITLPHYVSEEQRHYVDLSAEIEENLIVDEIKILVLIQKDDLIKLKADEALFNASLKFIKAYIQALKDEVAKRKATHISEEQILHYLSQNEEIRTFIKQTLDFELDYIRKNYAHFLDKWKYYKEFEKICQKANTKEKK